MLPSALKINNYMGWGITVIRDLSQKLAALGKLVFLKVQISLSMYSIDGIACVREILKFSFTSSFHTGWV